MNRRTLFQALALLACGCAPRAIHHGREANPDRLRRKIPIIPDDWTMRENLGTQVDWVDPKSWEPRNQNTARRTGKTVMVDRDGTPLSEADYYESGKKYAGCGSVETTLFWQSAEVIYNYEKAREGKDPWECDVGCGPEEGHYTLDQIEAILLKWGVPRLGTATDKKPGGKTRSGTGRRDHSGSV